MQNGKYKVAIAFLIAFVGIQSVSTQAWALSLSRFRKHHSSDWPRADIELRKYDPDQPEPDPSSTPPPLTSYIDFHRETGVSIGTNGNVETHYLPYPVIRYAHVSIKDPLNGCPIDNAKGDIKKAISDLTKSIAASLNTVKMARGAHCTALQTQLNASSANLGTAVTNQFVASQSIAANASQDQINNATQKALALNQFFATTSNALQSDCVSSITGNAQIIQKLLGQIITLTGIFYGGWEGIGIAITGQTVASLPIFKDALDTASSAVQANNEKTEIISLLCFFRQMQKNTCLDFYRPGDRWINGLDMTLETGAPKTTHDTLKKLEAQDPLLAADIKKLSEISAQSQTLIPLISQKAVKVDADPAEKELVKWCRESPPKELTEVMAHPPEVIKSLNSLVKLCDKLNHFQYPADLAKLLKKTNIELSEVNDYYDFVKKMPDEKPENPTHAFEKKYAQSLESWRFFETLKKSIDQYATGEQNRLDFLDLTRHLGESYIKTGVERLVRSNHKILTDHYWFSKREQYQDGKPTYSESVRSPALRSLINMCQTFDPTLACLYPSPGRTTEIQRVWIDHCVGPRSTLCSTIFKRNEDEKLNGNPGWREQDYLLQGFPDYLAYFNSLCGESPYKQ